MTMAPMEVFGMGRERSTTRLSKSFRYVILTALLLLLLPSQCVFGQVDEGSITGLVQDPTGAVVPNAQVTLLNTDQGITLNTTTSNSGEYTFSPVRIGHYSVSASAPGFSKTDQENLEVKLDQHLQVNIQLKPGATSETVQVTAAPPELQTEESSVGQSVTGQSVNNLPLNGRNFTFLAQLGAGVNTPRQIPAAMRPPELLPPMVCARRKTTICSMALTTIPTPLIS